METPSQSPIEIKRDTQKNIWLHFPLEPKQSSILDGMVESRAVITPQGRDFLPRDARDDIFERIARGTLHKSKRLGSGDEGVVNRVTDASSIFDIVFGKFEREAAVKKIKTSKYDRLLPWETIQVFDHIRPQFTQAGMQLITPFGATNDELFMPIMQGINLKHMLWELHGLGMPFPDLLKVNEFITDKTLALHNSVNDALYQYLTEKGLERTRKSQVMIEENQKDLYVNPTTENEVAVLVDFHPGEIERISDYRYEHWMLPNSVRDQIRAEPTFQNTSEQIMSNAVCFDPIAIYANKQG